MSTYFTTCKTIDEAKNLFRQLCKELHPDTSGRDSGNEFVKMYAEFKKFKPTSQTDQQKQDFETFDASEFYNMIRKFDGLNNIIISFVGSFIWLEDEERGATYFQKDKIKAIEIDGYNPARFASVKKSWYFSPIEYKQSGKSNKTLDTLKTEYGCKTFKAKSFAQLN
jgi:hypothetical protein